MISALIELWEALHEYERKSKGKSKGRGNGREEVLGAGQGEHWLWDQRTLTHLTSSPPISHQLPQQSGG